MKEYNREYADLWYVVPSPFMKLGGLHVLRAGRNRAKPGYHVGPKVIECHSLHFILEGSLTLGYGNKEVNLGKGDVFCLYPDVTYTYSLPCPAELDGRQEQKQGPGQPLRMVWLALGGSQVPGLVERAGWRKETPYLRDRLVPVVLDVLQSIIGTLDGHYEEELQLLSHLYRLFQELSLDGRTPSPAGVPPWLERCRDYFDLHYMENIRVEEAAQRMGVNRSHLSAAFTRAFGSSPSQYIAGKRMGRAAEMLGQSDIAITEIARSLGYGDIHRFTKAFRQYYGMAPSRYRTRLQENSIIIRQIST